MHHDLGKPVATAATTVAFVLAACSSSSTNTTPSTPQDYSAQQAEVVASDADAEVDLATAAAGASFSVSTPAAGTLSLAAAGVPGFGLQCSPAPTRTGDLNNGSPVNSDADPVPDSVTWTFTPPCVLSGPLRAITRSGQVDIVDPTPTTTDFGRRLRLTNFTKSWERVISGKTTTFSWNGVRWITGDNNGLRDSIFADGTPPDSFTTTYQFIDGTTATHKRSWVVTFAPDVAGSIAIDAPLPSGVWNILPSSGGRWTWTSPARSWNFEVSTGPSTGSPYNGLHYNAACIDPPRFDSGVLTIVAHDNTSGAVHTITVTFTSDPTTVCGTPTVTKS